MSVTVFPSVHLNGTSRGSLIEQQHDVWEAANKLMVALSEAAPHGRDYYVQEGNPLTQAQEEHRARVRQVQTIMDDSENTIIKLQEA
jgi:hypothetical protein